MKSIQTIYSGIQSVIQLKLNSIQKKQNEAPCFPLTKEVRGRFSQKKNPKNDTLILSKGLIFNATEKANGRFFSHNAKQRIVLAFITLLALLPQALQGQFITTWQTDNPGISGDNQITIPTTGDGYDYTVTWVDVNDATVTGTAGPFNGDATIDFPFAGTYQVSITGDFPQIYFNNTGDREKIINIDQWGDNVWLSMNKAFYSCVNLTSDAVDAPDLSQVTSMHSMFRNASSFNGDLSSWDVSNVETLNYTFGFASSFDGDISSWDVSNVENMSYLFYYASSFNQDLSSWEVDKVTQMNHMFRSASTFNQNLGSWDVSKVTNFSDFLDNSGLSSINYDATLDGWTSLPLLQSEVILGAEGLYYCSGVASRTYLADTYGWVFEGDIYSCGVTVPFVTTWQTDNPGTSADNQITIPTNGSGYDYTVTWVDVNDASVTGTVGPFSGDATIDFPVAGTYQVSITGDFPQIYFNNGGDKDKLLSVDQWGDNVWLSMQSAFFGCMNLTTDAVDAPDLRQVTSMNSMFRNASSFNGDLSSWDVSNVETLNYTFGFASSFDGDISSWDVSNVENMSYLFYYASSFNQDLSSWEVGNVKLMNHMFRGARAFDQQLGSWDVSNVENMRHMFYEAAIFNQGISGWDVSNVEDMSYLFFEATSFNQSLGTWNLSGVTTMDHALDNTAISQTNYDDALSAWAALPAVPVNVVLGASGLTYCNEEARSTLTDTYGWTIADAGKSGDCATPEPDPVSLDETLAHEVRYDGSITGMIWKNPTFTTEKLYTYHYDDMNRLTAAHYAEEAGGTFQDNRGYQSVPAIGYDYNGNIENLKRQGENNEGAIDVIDELSYSYDTDHDQPNQLMSVDDSRGVQAGFDNGNTSGDDYVYDANGNPTRDRNKGIESIEYNLLNLPTKITFNDNHYLTYLYDAAGIKLQQKEYRSDTLYKTTDYISSSIYVTMGQGEPVLQELMHDEGRIIPVILSDSEGAVEGYDYQYRLSDHLGNTRVIYSTNLEQYTMVEDFESGAVNGFTDLHVTTDENANTTLPLGENNKTGLLKSGETGALVFLHLNKGDTIDLQVNASYTDTPSDNTFASTAFSALFGTFNGTISGGEAPSALANEFDDALSGAAMAGKAEDTEAPRAYLNYIFFDDDMNYVTAGFEPITEAAYRVNAGEHETVRLDDIIADQEGYLLAYLSNENQEQVNVYFDDFTVHQSKTNLVFASDYYPYGMPFNQYYRTASIGSRYQYQGKEYLDEEGLNLYDFHARYYDPALGRFTTVDPMTTKYPNWTAYAGMAGNPVMTIDPDGKEPITLLTAVIIGAAIGGAGYTASVGFSDGGFQNWDWGEFGKSVGIGALSGAVSFGVGSAFGGAIGGNASSTIGKIGYEVARATVHGTSQQIVGAAFGNEPSLSGFAAGAAGSLMGSGLQAAGASPLKMIGASALFGGGVSELSDPGTFWQGFATAGIVAGTNHGLHAMMDTWQLGNDGSLTLVKTKDGELVFIDPEGKVIPYEGFENMSAKARTDAFKNIKKVNSALANSSNAQKIMLERAEAIGLSKPDIESLILGGEINRLTLALDYLMGSGEVTMLDTVSKMLTGHSISDHFNRMINAIGGGVSNSIHGVNNFYNQVSWETYRFTTGPWQ